MSKIFNRVTALALLAVAFVGGTIAMAGTGGTDFLPAVTMVQDWLEGGLGQLLALAIFAVGIAAGVLRQSLISVVVGIGCALTVAYGPAIIAGIVTAAI